MTDTDYDTDAEDVEIGEIMEETRNLPAVRSSEAIVARGEISVEEVVAQKEKIRDVMDAVMTRGIHYGLIPGVSKPSLFKPGAEAINVALRLAPHYDSEKIWHEGTEHLTVISKCTLKHIPTDLTIATGEGLCTTKEDRYATRQGERTCPKCGQATIIKGKKEYGGGWLCFAKKGGCGEKWPDGAHEIESQDVGKVPNPNLPDLYNTVLKMADKRALIAAVLNGTAASDVFTQDVEDAPSGVGTPGDEPYGPQSAIPEPPPAPVENQPLPPPKSWGQITEYVSAYDEGTYNIFNKFADAARRRMFPGSTDTKSLKKAERDELFQVTARAALALRNEVDAGKFPPPSVEEISRSWASVMEGEELAIQEEEEVNGKG
jgi:hypothetical protein